MTSTLETWMIEEVGVGARDVGFPVLWFTVSDGVAGGALQVMPLDDPRAISLLSSVYEVRELNGRMCHVRMEGNTVRFEELLRAARA